MAYRDTHQGASLLRFAVVVASSMFEVIGGVVLNLSGGRQMEEKLESAKPKFRMTKIRKRNNGFGGLRRFKGALDPFALSGTAEVRPRQASLNEHVLKIVGRINADANRAAFVALGKEKYKAALLKLASQKSRRGVGATLARSTPDLILQLVSTQYGDEPGAGSERRTRISG